MAQNLDPSSHGRGVLLFTTAFASVVQHAKKDGASIIDRQNDIEVLWNFYLEYKRRLDDMQPEHEGMKECGTSSIKIGARAVEMEKIYATMRALLDVLEILIGQAPTHMLARQILDERCISSEIASDRAPLPPPAAAASAVPMASSENWERLVRDQVVALGSVVPPSLGSTARIEQVLQAAGDIQDDDPNVARILCDQAYIMAQNLDPSIHGSSDLLFKTAFASVVQHAKKEGASIDRQNDIEVLWNFYLEYKSQHRFDDMQRELESMKESGTLSTGMGARAVEMEEIYNTLRALLDVLEILVGQAPTNRPATQILEEEPGTRPGEGGATEAEKHQGGGESDGSKPN